MNNMNQAYRLIMEAQEESKRERGLWHSRTVQRKGYEAELALDRAIDALNLVDIPPINRQDFGTESALMLKEILDRLQLPPVNMIPNTDDVGSQSLTRWEVPGSEIAIQLVKEGFDVNEFLFTPETVERIKQFYELIEEYPYYEFNPWKTSPGFYRFYITTPGHLLPPKWNRWLPREKNTILLYGQTLWQWLGLAITTLIAFAIVFGIRFLLKRYVNIANPYKKVWLELLIPAFTLWMITFWEVIIDEGINITGTLLQNILQLSTILEGSVFAWFAFMLFNAIGSTIMFNMCQESRSFEAVLVRNGVRLLGVLAGFIVFYTTSQEIGIALGPIIASFGISSIAIGLGVKPYIENLVGGLTLFLNRPIKIGDFCELGGVIGTVEDISLRSTLIRTLERKLIYVPNTVVSTSQIVNHSKRDKYFFDRTLSLSYDSVHEELEQIMENLRNMLAQHPKLSEESISIGSLSHQIINLDIFAYILTTDLAESILIEEEVLLKINKILYLTGAKVLALAVSNKTESSSVIPIHYKNITDSFRI
ncbi:MAG: mechanosensitive ion channel [Okeania sp. SIO3I5]|uniref:mechanosensitive ion channel family protein n=1 Tax=Okeania sp. SIO3I5 TaxID=2607805 RepID=UPI0013BC7420|nr:mechanosensitive ion channel domain-containing protein [Okeania sp. SIO3I5]NEQ35100.1 mechanosensitive ion channel [Okeania sp. SIO3I5]